MQCSSPIYYLELVSIRGVGQAPCEHDKIDIP